MDLWHTKEIGAALQQHFDVADDLAVYRAFGLDKIVQIYVGYTFESGERAITSRATVEPGCSRNAWGVPLTEIQAGAAHYSEYASAPLSGYDTPASLDRYPLWPQVGRFDYGRAENDAQFAAQEFAVLGPMVSFFETYGQLRGLEQSLVDLVESPELVDAGLDRIEAIQAEMLTRLFARARHHIDLVLISEDIAGQQSLLMAPSSWARHLQPRLKRLCDLIHDHGVRACYHIDGAARPLLRAILDCGVDVLTPVQHACPGMDMAELKREFGDRVIFHGGVDNQAVLSRGTPEQVRAEVRDCLRTLGAGREGYICCSCHNVQAGTPLENIFAMVETVKVS